MASENLASENLASENLASENPRERLLRQGASQGDICMRHCGARCCRYVTVSITTPVCAADWDEIRWWLAHEGVMVTKDEEGWMVSVDTPCRNLASDGGCRVYDARMNVCKKHAVEDCEFVLPLDYDVMLKSESDLADYLERRRLKRGKDVAAQIRKGEALRAKAPASPRRTPLVSIQPLPERT